ncbi:MAG: hypothetical protein EOM21_20330 [Gammaproteobacteria bacterium]|nr:hypothetical protein [Gammaproteobacteria bacterium]
MPRPPNPWRRDLERIPPQPRRLARYALQLERALRGRRGRTFNRALVALLLPLLDEQVVAGWLPRTDAQDDDDWDDSSSPFEPDLEEDDTRALHKRLASALERLPARFMARLAAADGDAALNPSVALLCDSLHLGPVEQAVLDSLACYVDAEPRRR